MRGVWAPVLRRQRCLSVLRISVRRRIAPLERPIGVAIASDVRRVPVTVLRRRERRLSLLRDRSDRRSVAVRRAGVRARTRTESSRRTTDDGRGERVDRRRAVAAGTDLEQGPDRATGPITAAGPTPGYLPVRTPDSSRIAVGASSLETRRPSVSRWGPRRGPPVRRSIAARGRPALCRRATRVATGFRGRDGPARRT